MKILYRDTVSANLQRLRSMAECFGVTTDLVELRPGYLLKAALRDSIDEGDHGVVLDVESLKGSVSKQELPELSAFIELHALVLLLFATHDDEATNYFIATLTKGAVTSVNRAARAATISFPSSGASFSHELCSQTYSRQEKEALTLILSQDERSTPLMELDGLPAFAFCRAGRSQILIWSTPSVLDIHRPLRAEKEFELATDEYIPPIIFFRSAFGDQCWHNPEATAGIVIDDPLLQKQYGFIDFEQLLCSARAHGYHITLAFIPWNHWRSRSKEIRLFLSYSDCFSICVHGCDHTDNEYGSTDYDLLLRKNIIASERMDRHGRRTGLPTEPLMVCPQEKYSLEAMRAFSDSRQFLAVVCTACIPRNLAVAQLCAADLLLPAQDCFFGFPVFKRHYSGNMAVFAMALFLGKPAILVEHHDFFEHGPHALEEFVGRLALLRPNIQWRSLAETVVRTHARRRVSAEQWELKFFTDTFKFDHEVESCVTYRLIRRLPATTVINGVLVDDRDVRFSRSDGFLSFEIVAHEPHTFSVQIQVTPVTPTTGYSSDVRYQASVALRRALSEMRDNVIVRNRFAHKAERFIVKTMKNTVRHKNGSTQNP